MRPSCAALLSTAAALLPIRGAAGGDDGTPQAAAVLARLRSEDPGRRREALESVVLRAREMSAVDEARLRPAVEKLLPSEEDPGLRALAVRALARLGGEVSLAPLLRALEAEEEPGPQAALLDAFADLPAEAAGRALSKVLFGDGDPRLRALAAGALGRVPGEAPLRALRVLSEATQPWPVQSAILLGLSLRDDPSAVDAAIRALRSGDPAVREAAHEAAEALLGEDLGPDPGAWERRWEEVRAKWTPPGPEPNAERAVLSSPAPPPETRSQARFYDLPVTGARVAFVVDCSQSMWGSAMETARAELTAAVKGLRTGQRFGVVLFNEKVWTWRDELVPATPAMKWAFVKTIPDLPTRSYTNIHDSLERAFGWTGTGRSALPDPPGLDEIFFLTDGEPNRGRTRDPERIAEAVRGWNEKARARVHCVALGDRPATALLERIARESGGRFTRK